MAGANSESCVQCNNWLKFGKLGTLLNRSMLRLSHPGHYAQIHPIDTRFLRLIPGEARLVVFHRIWGCGPELGLYPVRTRKKISPMCSSGSSGLCFLRSCSLWAGIRSPRFGRLAGEAGLRVANKKDSYEICFVPGNDYAAFLKSYRPMGDTAGKLCRLRRQGPRKALGLRAIHCWATEGAGCRVRRASVCAADQCESKRSSFGDTGRAGGFRGPRDRFELVIDPPGSEFRCDVKVR